MLSTSPAQALLVLVFLLTNASVLLRAAELTPSELVARHLNSLGSPEARSFAKSRVVQAPATYRILVGGHGAIDGKFVFASRGPESNFLFKINASAYRGEQFICDGNKISVAGTYNDKTRSEFGDFVLPQSVLLRDSLLGGVWSTNWPLLDVEGHKAHLHFEGSKKIDGRTLLALRYLPGKSTDLDIMMYFDPETYQHVMTIYRMEPSTSIVGGETAQAGKSSRRYQLEESFSDFHTADGLTLPTHYDLRYTLEGESGFTKTVEWEVTSASISNNMPIDDRSFQIK
jgi:hypothetical protein